MDHLLRATARAEQQHFWFHGFRAFVLPLVRQALEGVSNPRILDCGCGTGANVDWLSRFGEAYGFDLTESGLQFGRDAGRTRLARAGITAAPFADATFDLVTAFDVLVTLSDDDERAAAAELFRLARPGAYVLVNVAAMDILRGDHSVLSHERRRYSRGRLNALLTGAGLAPVRLTYTNASLFLPMLLTRTLQRWRGLQAEDHAAHDITVPAAPLNAVLTAILRAESLWVRRHSLAVGTSLLCLARRPDGASSSTRGSSASAFDRPTGVASHRAA
jgi:SAM-dependent methyltransferase